MVKPSLVLYIGSSFLCCSLPLCSREGAQYRVLSPSPVCDRAEHELPELFSQKPNLQSAKTCLACETKPAGALEKSVPAFVSALCSHPLCRAWRWHRPSPRTPGCPVATSSSQNPQRVAQLSEVLSSHTSPVPGGS